MEGRGQDDRVVTVNGAQRDDARLNVWITRKIQNSLWSTIAIRCHCDIRTATCGDRREVLLVVKRGLGIGSSMLHG